MKLFEPLNVAGLVIPNRVMVPARVTRLSGEDGFVNKDINDRYVRYAQGAPLNTVAVSLPMVNASVPA